MSGIPITTTDQTGRAPPSKIRKPARTKTEADSAELSMDRPLGPLGVATQSTGPVRGLPDNPASMRRPVPAGPPPNLLGSQVPPVPPIPNIRNVPPPNPQPAYAARVLALARQAMQKALQENEAQAQSAEGGVVSSDLKTGVTIDLSRKNIRELPEEIVDVIKDELERLDCYCPWMQIYLETMLTCPTFSRLALSHNQLSSFPSRLPECTLLRYLNVRNNQFREFPLPVRATKRQSPFRSRLMAYSYVI